MSLSYLNQIEARNPDLFNEIFQRTRVVAYFSDLNALVNDKTSPEKAYAVIFIGKNIGVNQNDGQFGIINTDYCAFPLSKAGIDISTVMFHEIGHSLGISAHFQTNPYGLTVTARRAFALTA